MTREEAEEEYEYGVIYPDPLDDDMTTWPGKGAFCESWRVYRKDETVLHGSLDDSVTCGCAQCRLFCTVYPLARIGPGMWCMDRDEVKMRLLRFSNKAPFDRVHHGYAAEGWGIYNGQGTLDSIRIFLLEADSSLEDVPVLEPIPGFTGSDQSFRQAKAWLEDCLEKHSCQSSSPRSPSPLPKRILDLGDFPDGIRLLEDPTDTAPYLCLSHCWGDPEHHPLQTTSQNLATHKKGIQFADLPKTFQEAAAFVRRLGYRYLWIDSLCIIQDDDEDWRAQASRMANIYQECLLTVAANAAPNSSHGLFSHSSPGMRGTSLSSMTGNKVDSNVWICQSSLPHEREPLSTRGWVLQERALSPRTLYFGKDELTWECREAATCQCVMSLQPVGALKALLHPGPKGHLKPIESFFDDWYRVVEEYSRLQLSHEEDVFPAISGISKQFRAILGSQYMAGLWRTNIVNDLCWGVFSPGTGPVSSQRPAKWRAPSFSWASIVLGQESHLFRRLSSDAPWQPRAKLVAERCVPVGADDTGQISDAYIDLEGTLLEARVTTRGHDDDYPWTIVSDSHPFRCLYLSPDYDYDIDGQSRIASEDKVFCLLVSETETDTDDDDDDDWSRVFLVLRQAEQRRGMAGYGHGNSGPVPVYERIGILRETGGIKGVYLGPHPRPVDIGGSKVVVRII